MHLNLTSFMDIIFGSFFPGCGQREHFPTDRCGRQQERRQGKRGLVRPPRNGLRQEGPEGSSLRKEIELLCQLGSSQQISKQRNSILKLS